MPIKPRKRDRRSMFFFGGGIDICPESDLGLSDKINVIITARLRTKICSVRLTSRIRSNFTEITTFWAIVRIRVSQSQG